LSGWGHQERGRAFGRSVFQLLGHLLGTAFIYITLFAVAWIIGLASAWLNRLHPFGDDIFGFVSKVEKAILYGDTGLCGFVTLAGMWRFCKEVIK